MLVGLIFLLSFIPDAPLSPHCWSSQKWGAIYRIKLFTLGSNIIFFIVLPFS